MASCVSPNGPYDIVEQAQADARANSFSTLQGAGTAIDNLGLFTLDAVNFNLLFDDVSLIDLSRFAFPNYSATIDLNDFPVTYAAPATPPGQQVHVPVIGAPPIFEETSPVLNFPAQPGPLDTRTFVAPDLDDVVLPLTPVITIDDAPDLIEINLDDLLDLSLNLPTFDALTPTTPLPDLELAWDYTNRFYSSDLVNLVKSTITEAINNGTSLPAAVEDALFERADGREEVNRFRAQQEVDTLFASRGWSIPQGAMVKRQDEISYKAISERSAVSREVYITRRTDEVEARKHYLAEGIAIETQLINDHISFYERSLRAGRIILDASIAIANIQVQRYNIETEIFKVEVARFDALIRAEFIKVDELKAEIEIRIAKLEINRVDLQRYTAHIEGVNAQITLYIAQIDGAVAVAKVNTERVAAFTAEVRAYTAEQQAKESEYRGWASAIQGELGKVQVFEAQASAFGRQIDAYSAGADVEIARTQSDVDVGKLRVDEFVSLVNGARAAMEGEIAKLEAAVAAYSAEVRVYEANIAGRTAEADSLSRVKDLTIQQNRAAADVSIEGTRLEITQSIEISRQILAALQSIGQYTSNLAAAAMASSNVSASMSGSSSDSRSCSESVSSSI